MQSIGPKYVKIQRKIFLEDDLAMILIDFGLLRSLYCKISYLLAEEHWSHTNLGIWQPTYDSVCEDNSWIHGKCRQRFLSNVDKRFFFIFSTFFTFFNVFLNFHLNVYFIYVLYCPTALAACTSVTDRQTTDRRTDRSTVGNICDAVQ